MKRFISLLVLALFLIVAGFDASGYAVVRHHRKAKYVGGGALGGAAIGALAGGGKGAVIGGAAGAGAGYLYERHTRYRHRSHYARRRPVHRRYYRRG